jgi:predicted MFS family arabinose efflux permease
VFLIFGLSQWNETGFGSPVTIGAFAGAAGLLATFRTIEGRVTNPLLPLGAFRSRSLMGASLVAFTLTAVTSPAGVLGSVYLQGSLGYSPRGTGFALLPFSLSVIAGSFGGARLESKIGARMTMRSGLIALTAAMVLLSRISATGGLGYLVIGISVAGLALGCASVASTAVGTGARDRHDQGVVSGLLNTAAQIGTAVGIAALTTIAAARTEAAAEGATATMADVVEGLTFAFFVGAGLALLGALVPSLLLRRSQD